MVDTVVLSTETERFLEQLDTFSKNSLVHRTEIGFLLELSRNREGRALLAGIAFGAKVCWSTSILMKRIGPGAEGYERLLSEFQSTMEKTLLDLSTLLEHSPEDVRTHFTEKLFADTPNSLQVRIELFHDISWIKNWTIDHQTDVPL